ncbi:MAG: tetratricopeptide repeat protein [Nitrospirae bacterium]|nr:tetratricopeptide repeat protein [Nitrospirota bacterium]
MKYRISLLSLVAVFFFVSTVHADVVTFTKEYTYQASDFDSRNSSRTLALEMVKRLLLEELGTYLVSETEVKNMRLTKDQVTTYSAGIVGAEVIDEKWDGKTYWLKAKVSADPKEVEKALKKLVEDKSKTQELEDTRRKAEELTKENKRLRRALAAGTEAKNRDKITEAKNVEAYEKTIIGLNAVEWFQKGYKAAIGERWEEALDAFTKAIELKPDYAKAYHARGLAYLSLDNYQQAVQDFNKAIELKPDYAEAYYFRGLYYNILDNYQQAISEFTQTLKLKPDYAEAYCNRGNAYNNLGNYQQAINDFTKAIELTPDNADAYVARGIAYDDLGNYQQAIKDYKIAARLGNKSAQSNLTKLGIKW